MRPVSLTERFDEKVFEFRFGDVVVDPDHNWRGTVIDERRLHPSWKEANTEKFLVAAKYGLPICVVKEGSCIPEWVDGTTVKSLW